MLGRAVPAGIVIAVVTMSVFAIVQLDSSIDADHARTVAVLVAGSVALMNLYRVARPMNRWRMALVITMVSLFALAFVTPWGRDLFELPLTKPWAYAVAAVAIVVAWPLLESRKSGRNALEPAIGSAAAASPEPQLHPRSGGNHVVSPPPPAQPQAHHRPPLRRPAVLRLAARPR